MYPVRPDVLQDNDIFCAGRQPTNHMKCGFADAFEDAIGPLMMHLGSWRFDASYASIKSAVMHFQFSAVFRVTVDQDKVRPGA